VNKKINRPTGDRTGHPEQALFEEYLDGALLTGEARVLERHVDQCDRCADLIADSRQLRSRLDALPGIAPQPQFADSVVLAVTPELARRRALTVQLNALGHLAPSPQFANTVVARIAERREAHSSARARRTAPRTFEARLVRWFRDPRQLFATLGGISVVPIAVLVAVVTSVLSNDQLSPGALISFARWKAVEGFEALGTLFGSVGSDLPSWAISAFGFASPGQLLMVFSGTMALGTMISVWVLYRTLSAPPLTGTVNGHRTV